MKKTDPTWNKYTKRRLTILNRHKKKRTLVQKNSNAYRTILSLREKKNKKFRSKPSSVNHLINKAPENFSLLTNTEEVIKYFDNAEVNLRRDKPVYFDLADISELGVEALSLLCSFLNDPSFNNGVATMGNLPTDPVIKNMFEKAGFYNFVRPNFQVEQTKKDLYGSILHRISRIRVDPEIARKVSESAFQYTFGSSSKDLIRRSVYPILIECMANTHNHASIKSSLEYSWWLLAYNEDNSSTTKFCFIDLGIGVFDSINRKQQAGSLARRLKRNFVKDQNDRTLEKIFIDNDLAKNDRGFGINYIYQLVKKDPNIENFHLISNDIHAIVEKGKNDTISLMKTKFRGTLYYWELVNNV